MGHEFIFQIDRIAVIVYFFSILVIGLSASKDADGDTLRYFLSGRNLRWGSIGISLIAADVLCGHIMGEKGPFAAAMAVDLELMGILGLIFLGWRAGPALTFFNSFTTNDSLERMYGGKVRSYVSLLFIATYLLVRLSLVLLLGAFLIGYFSNLDSGVAIAAAILISGIYSIAGGFSAVISTQIVQAIFMLLGFAALVIGVAITPSLAGMHVLGAAAAIGHVSRSSPTFPWLAIVVGIPVVALWLWLTDQYVLQHVFSARSNRDMKKGISFVALAKTLAVGTLVAVFLGMHGFYLDQAGGSLPSFVKGIVLIGVLSAIMSSLSGLFNSTSALFTMDIYRRKKPQAEERKLVLVGRLSTMVVVLISLLWMPLLGLIGWKRSEPLQSLLACFAAVVVAVFLTGVFWKRATSVAAVSAVVVGIASGAFRVIFEQLSGPWQIRNGILLWLVKTQYLNFAAIDFFISLTVIVLASLFFPSNGTVEVLQKAQRN